MNVAQHEGKSLHYLTVEPEGYDPESTYPVVVLLHGYGANMGDLANLSPAIHLDGYVYVYPNAPISLQIGPGVYGYAWTNPGGQQNPGEAEEAETLVAGFLQEIVEKCGISYAQMVLGGFSQGGMMTYLSGLTAAIPFAGLAALSARVSEPEALSARLNSHRDQPIFVTHGTEDAVIPVQAGRDSVQFLKDAGYQPEYHEYAIGHEISEGMVEDLRNWLAKVLPPRPQ